MESKILIDISYSTREPMIVIQHTFSDDPRDKLINMLIGQAMPGAQNGYCRITRTHSDKGAEYIEIVPLDPIDVIRHIPQIVELAISNSCIDTTEIRPLAAERLLDANKLLSTAKP